MIAKPLTLEWIEAVISQPLFRAAMGKGGGRDPHRLGWEPVEPRGIALDLRIGNIQSASAEGIVGLASIAEAARGRRLRTRLVGPPVGNRLGGALQLNQLITGKWGDPATVLDEDLDGPLVDPLRRWTLETAESCGETANIIRDRAGALLARSSSPDSGLLTAVHLLVHQALLNVYEHAYGPGSASVAFSAITVGPTKQWLGQKSPLTQTEQTWLESSGGELLEVAIADHGAGVPATLWDAYRRKHSQLFEDLEFESRAIATNKGQRARAELQQHITQWSLAHDSTRKNEKDFSDRRGYLNWRGLHRAANVIADLSGSIVIRSGQARAGFVFREFSGDAIRTDQQRPRKEFPGTTLLLRIPIPTPIPRHASVMVAESPQRLDLHPNRVVRSSVPKSDLTDTPGGLPTVVAICHPFVILQEDSGEMLDLIRSIPPNCIQIHAFMKAAAEPILSQFHAFEDEQEHHLPRIICFWCSGEKPIWRFAGLMPREARAFVKSIELGDTVPIPFDLMHFAKELHRAYAPFVSIRDNAFRLDVVTQDIDEKTAEQAFQLSFDEFVNLPGSKPWLTEGSQTLVRLRNGKLVKRYVNVLELLNASDTLARSAGRQLAHRLERFQYERRDLRVITDSEASYFLARHLLSEQHINIDLRPDGDTPSFKGPTVIFADAIYRGKTMKFVASREKELIGAICAVDLRHNGTQDWVGPEVFSLVKFPFEPGEIPEREAQAATRVLEVDQVTLDPCEPADPNQYSLGTSSERTKFINDNPQLLRYGIHLSGGRIHVVSHSTIEMVHSHSDELTHWIVEEAIRAIELQRSDPLKKDIVLFTRADAYVRELVPQIAMQLESQHNKRVFAATIPAAPRKSRQVFARVDYKESMLSDVHLLGYQSGLVFKPPSDFVAILLDDATVTGRGLLNFVTRLSETRNTQRPTIIIAIPIFTRLAPIENQLYATLLKTLGGAHQGPEISFTFTPLFRLSVRSVDDPAAASVFKYLNWIARNEYALGPRLHNYIDKIRQRLEEAVQEPGRHGERPTVCSHPFYSGLVSRKDAEVSSRTIWIRHLLALYEQNVAVLGELLHEIRLACQAGDDSLLSLFASEPSLLELRPLRRCCHQDLTDLAMLTIKSFGRPASLKSDALVVLLGSPLPAADIVGDIAAHVQLDEDLLDQFLVMLLATAQTAPLTWSAIGNAIYKRATNHEALVLIRTSLKAWEEIRRPYGISTHDDAEQAVIEAITRTIYHASGDRIFNVPTRMWIQVSRADERARQPASGIAPLFRPAIAFARQYFLPALEGVEHVARQQQNGQAANALRNAHSRLIVLLTELDEWIDGLGNGPLGEHRTNRIEELWTQIRECTQFGPPHTYLASLPQHGEAAGVLESWMSSFFCLPADVAEHLRRLWSRLRVTADWQQSSNLRAILLRAPLADVQEAFELLFEDAQKHGSGEIRVAFVRLTENGSQLKMLVSNVVSPTSAPGSGKSQQRVKEIAARNRWDVSFPENSNPKEPYTVRVFFPIVYEL